MLPDMFCQFRVRHVFVAVEHANSEVVGIHASRSANRFEALEPVRQGVHADVTERAVTLVTPGMPPPHRITAMMHVAMFMRPIRSSVSPGFLQKQTHSVAIGRTNSAIIALNFSASSLAGS